ncbi:MAG: D-amino acid aminotransferase [Chromatiales bacterium]|nr:D-amino acid aminotransferase [Chromatiales bacterium]
MPVVYLNGEFVALDAARVSVLDRGFLFGDSVYEVIPVYGARLFRFAQHCDRLWRSLDAVRMAAPFTREQLQTLLDDLLAANPSAHDRYVYLQITRGAPPRRDHAFPADIAPTVFAMSGIISHGAELAKGVAAVTLPDERWLRCDIKSTALLANVLARQHAVDAGAVEVILLRDEAVTEGAASNVFVVRAGAIRTPPDGPGILAGITRDLVLEIARQHGLDAAMAPVSSADLLTADEVWLTSSTREILPVVTLDRRPVGAGAPGPMFARMQALYGGYKQAVRAGRAA